MPTPQAVVDEMLNVAAVTQDDFVIDLGSGDGRIVLTAASRFHARGKGIEIDPELVEQSNMAAQQRGLDRLVRFENQDALKARIADATVLTLYLLPELMHQLRNRIYAELKPGARVVSHDFRFNDWAPDQSHTIDAPEKYGTTGPFESTIYLWIVPAKVAGHWNAMVEDGQGERYAFDIKQSFQRIEGVANLGGRTAKIEDGKVQGAHIRFFLPGADGMRREFSGTVEGDTMRGTIAIHEGHAEWRATRRRVSTTMAN